MTKYHLSGSKYAVIGWELARAQMALARYRLKEPIPKDDLPCVRDVAEYLAGAVHSHKALEGKSMKDKFLLIGGKVPFEHVDAEHAIFETFDGYGVFRNKEVSACASVLKSLGDGKAPPIKKVEAASEFTLKLLGFMNEVDSGRRTDYLL